MENPDLVLQETGSRPTYSRLNYVPSGDTLRRDAISSVLLYRYSQVNINNNNSLLVSIYSDLRMNGCTTQAGTHMLILTGKYSKL